MALTKHRFIAPPAEPQCPKCGSRDLDNLSEDTEVGPDRETWECYTCGIKFETENIFPL